MWFYSRWAELWQQNMSWSTSCWKATALTCQLVSPPVDCSLPWAWVWTHSCMTLLSWLTWSAALSTPYSFAMNKTLGLMTAVLIQWCQEKGDESELYSHSTYSDLCCFNHNRDISSWKPILVPGPWDYVKGDQRISIRSSREYSSVNTNCFWSLSHFYSIYFN